MLTLRGGLATTIDSGRIIRPLAQRLPGHYRFTPSKDIADAIEWAKVHSAA